jgi:hypothetical protein
MKKLKAIRLLSVVLGLAAVAVLSFPRAVAAQQNWNAKVGAETQDMGRQALAFLPNEIWIHTGDSITWTMKFTPCRFWWLAKPSRHSPWVVQDFRLVSRASMARPA